MAIREPSDGDFRLVDADADGHADGLGTTSTGAAGMTHLNGNDIEDTTVLRDVEPVGTGTDASLPTEPWGFGLIEWSS